MFLGETEEKSVSPIYVKPFIFTYLTPLKGIPTAKKRNFFSENEKLTELSPELAHKCA